MTNTTRRYSIVVFLLFLALIAFPPAASAQFKLPISITEQVSPVFDLPDTVFGEKNVGYLHTSLRLFSVSLFVFDGRLVIYDKNASMDLAGPELEKIETMYGNMFANVPLRLRYGNRVIFLVYILVFLFALKRQLAQE